MQHPGDDDRLERENTLTSPIPDLHNVTLEEQEQDIDETYQDSEQRLENNILVEAVRNPRDEIVTSLSNESSHVDNHESELEVPIDEEENNACFITPHKNDELLCEKVATMNIGRRPGRPRKKKDLVSWS